MANGGLKILVKASRCISDEILSADAAAATWHNEEFNVIVAWISLEQLRVESQGLIAGDKSRVDINIGEVGIDHLKGAPITGHLFRFEIWRGHNLKVKTTPRLQHLPFIAESLHNARATDRIIVVDGNGYVGREVSAIAINGEPCHIVAQLHPVFFHRTHP